jgi:hypothetical protein
MLGRVNRQGAPPQQVARKMATNKRSRKPGFDGKDLISYDREA